MKNFNFLWIAALVAAVLVFFRQRPEVKPVAVYDFSKLDPGANMSLHEAVNRASRS